MLYRCMIFVIANPVVSSIQATNSASNSPVQEQGKKVSVRIYHRLTVYSKVMYIILPWLESVFEPSSVSVFIFVRVFIFFTSEVADFNVANQT